MLKEILVAENPIDGTFWRWCLSLKCDNPQNGIIRSSIQMMHARVMTQGAERRHRRLEPVRQTGISRDRQRNRHRDSYAGIGREIYMGRHRDKQSVAQTDRHRERQSQRQINTEVHRDMQTLTGRSEHRPATKSDLNVMTCQTKDMLHTCWSVHVFPQHW